MGKLTRRRQRVTRAEQDAWLKLYEKHGDWYEVLDVLRDSGNTNATTSTIALAAHHARRRQEGKPRREGNLTDEIILQCAKRLHEDGSVSKIDDLVFELGVSAAKLEQIQRIVVDGEEWTAKAPIPRWASYMPARFQQEIGQSPLALVDSPPATYGRSAKRELVRQALSANPEVAEGNRAMARGLGVSEGFVRKMRKETETELLPAAVREALLDKIREVVRSEIAAFAEEYDVCVEKKTARDEHRVSVERANEKLVQKVRERTKEILGASND